MISIWKRGREGLCHTVFCRNRGTINSAQTESVAAGALHLLLGGDHYYFGKLVHKQTIGDDLMAPEARHIRQMNVLMYFTAITGLLVFSLIRALWVFHSASPM